VLDRKLDGFQDIIPAPIINNDTVLSSIQKANSNLQTLTLEGDITGIIIFNQTQNRYEINTVLGQSKIIFPNVISSFLSLTDTPDIYTTAGYIVRVNAGATGLEFWALPTYDNYVNWRINNVDSATGAISLTTTGTLSILGSGAIAVSAASAGITALAKMTLSHSTADGYLHLPSGGAAPTLWLLSPTPTGTGCFNGCTNLSNYASIPAGWK
jgi:hypothetical protein